MNFRPVRNFPIAFVLIAAAALAQDSHRDSGEQGITRDQANAILDELRQIRKLLEKEASEPEPAPPPTGKLKIEGGYMLGSKDAPYTVVEFTDYECPFCRQFEMTTFPQLRKKYIDTGKIRFVSRNLPLSIHPHAARAALAVMCAGDQGQFWKMRDLVFANQKALTDDGLAQDAKDLSLDLAVFQSCLDTKKHAPEIRSDVKEAASLQLDATPSFLVGKTTTDGVEGTILMGTEPLAAFEAVLERAK
jgi:protein-disulfide isomerase